MEFAPEFYLNRKITAKNAEISALFAVK